VRSRALANLFFSGGVMNIVMGCALLATLTLVSNSLPNMLMRQLEAGELGLWGFFLLGIAGFLFFAVLEKAGLLYPFAIVPIATGALLILMGFRKAPSHEALHSSISG